MNKQNLQAGFTMVELVIVIVILGILAAVAAPKFMNIQGNAKISVAKSNLGAVRTGVSLAHAKILASGQNTGRTGNNKDWPTLVELRANKLAANRISATQNLQIAESDAVSGVNNASLPKMELPNMTTAQVAASRQVRDRSRANSATRNFNGNEGWSYYPGDEIVSVTRIADAVLWINDQTTTNQDGAGTKPNKW